MLFHFTITGLPRVFEPRVPDAAELVECARISRDRYGAGCRSLALRPGADLKRHETGSTIWTASASCAPIWRGR